MLPYGEAELEGHLALLISLGTAFILSVLPYVQTSQHVPASVNRF